MKWKKNGQIFNPLDFRLPNNCKYFAQSPQALVFDSFVRVFFSTRQQDLTGKFLSHIAYVDFTRDFESILKTSDKEIISLGRLGCFDEHGIFPLNVYRHEGIVYGYIGGWTRRRSVSIETSIGVAVSRDQGETFQRLGHGPVLSNSINEPFLVGDPFVSFFGNKFFMWYIYGERWITNEYEKTPQRVYKITYATSDDGINWKKSNERIIPDTIDENECQALPTVFYYNSWYHMYFCYRNAFGFRKGKEHSYKLGYARSKDLLNWERKDEVSGIETSDDGWDSEMQCYPHCFVIDDQPYLLYNGNEFGKYGFGLAKLIDS